MGKAERGTAKDIGNRMKSKGLQKLKWYCQICEKQCRDENGFRNHTQGESHQRKALQAGQNASRTIGDYSRQFQADFVRQLRMAHNEKKISANKFYNQYIQNKEHVHMNSTKWHTLSEFVKHLGRSGIVRVQEDEKEGLTIQWIDNSPEALERADAARKKERQQRGDEYRTQKLLEQQIERANATAATTKQQQDDEEQAKFDLQEGQTISIDAPIQATAPQQESKPKIKKTNVFAKRKKISESKS